MSVKLIYWDKQSGKNNNKNYFKPVPPTHTNILLEILHQMFIDLPLISVPNALFTPICVAFTETYSAQLL